MAQRSNSAVHIPPDQIGPLQKATDDGESGDHQQRTTTITVIAPQDLKKVPPNNLAPPSPVTPARQMAPQARPDHMRVITRPPPGDPRPKSPVRGSESSNPKASRDYANRRQSWFEGSFNERSTDSIKQQVEGEAMISAEVKTNVIIKDEFTFITDLSYHLAERYQRSITSIVVTVHHGACMLYGGTFDPAYVLNITSLDAAFSLTVNKRNSALIQAHMDESLGVPPARGLINFIGVRSDCAATNGKTVAGMLDEAARASASTQGGRTPSISTSRPGTSGTTGSERRRSHRLSTTFGANLKRLSTLGLGNFTPPATPSDAKGPHSPTALSPGGMAAVAEEEGDEEGDDGGPGAAPASSGTRGDRSTSKLLSSHPGTTTHGVPVQSGR